MEKLGLQLYTVRDYLTSPEEIKTTFQKLVEIGYTEGQTASGNWYGIPAEDFAAICKETGLSICGTHFDFNRILNETEQVMREHEAVGTTNIGLGGMPGEARESLESLKVFVDQYNNAARILHKNGFKLTYHNHSFEFEKLSGVRMMDYLVDNFDPDATSFVLDTHWVQDGGGDVIHWIKKLAGRVDILHLKDYAIVEGQRAFAEIFEGNLNFPGILAAAEEIGVKHYVVEQDSCPGDPFASVKLSCDNLKKNGYLK